VYKFKEELRRRNKRYMMKTKRKRLIQKKIIRERIMRDGKMWTIMKMKRRHLMLEGLNDTRWKAANCNKI
jgi:hypothetical protein